MGEVIAFPLQQVIESGNAGENVSMSLHFVRHGAKTKKGELRRNAIGEAEHLGEQIASGHEGMQVFTEIYSGTKNRVRETAQAIARGIRRQVNGDIYGPEEYGLLSHETFLLSEGKSEYFHRVDERLQRAFNSGPLGRSRRIHKAEKENMQDWLASDRGRPDPGTASPWEVARNVAVMTNACLDVMDSKPSNSHTDYILVTHEHVLAALVQYFLAPGSEIFEDIGRIGYLEDVTITVKRDEEGERYMYATIRGNNYIIASSSQAVA